VKRAVAKRAASQTAPPKAKAKRAGKSSLSEYKKKRDFARTPEPTTPEPKAARPPSTGHGFVVQKHAARRTHYDLRIELDGVLKSWAVTRGPSLSPAEKRLAVKTEDHPLAYLDFEGNIPKGEYGGGAMIVWDRGDWEPVGDPHRGLTKGHLEFALAGSRLKGRWHLVRMKPKRGERTEPWLLIKGDDEFAREPGSREITDLETTSFLSGLTTEALAQQGELRSDHAARGKVRAARKRAPLDVAALRGARKGLLPPFLEPIQASSCDKPPSGPRWIHEIKYDGYRTQLRIDGRDTKLLTRKGLDWTDRFRAVATAAKALDLPSALIDGEVVVEDVGGIPSFNLLQADLSAGRQDRLRYHAFDILYCEGFDLRQVSLRDRKGLLEQALAHMPADSPISYSGHVDDDGPLVFAHAAKLGLEGIISKRADLPYRGGRSDNWLKTKTVDMHEFVVVGYEPSTATKGSVASLLLGYYERGKLHYCGHVGTGWSGAEAMALRTDLDARLGERPAFARPLPPEVSKATRWVKPERVAMVQYRGWSGDGIVRQASFKGIREDKPASEVTLDDTPRLMKRGAMAGLGQIRLTHPDRLLWQEGVTKQGLAEFYVEIADWILPHIKDRVLSLVRNPGGPKGKNFFAKHPWAGLSKAVRHVDVGEKEPMLAIDDVKGLVDLVQAGVVEIHPWGSRAGDLERPDRLIFDLDPGEDVTWPAVIEAAIDVRDRLAAEGLKSFVKTSGGKGLHVVVPIVPRVSWDEAKAFTQKFAEEMAKARPDRYLAVMSKRARRGRIFVDYLRNGRGSTAVGAYSTRALPGAPISTPLNWDELSEGIRANHFRIDNLLQRLDFVGRDPWEGFFEVKQRI
jgi:bifunctional non-homologous end joining protein LigD